MLELEGISFAPAGRMWVEPCSLSFQAGALSVLVGATGAGKTTMMRMMAGLERPTSGRIILNGIDITRTPVRQRSVAMVYQAFVNYPAWSVRENIASPMRVKRASAVDIQRKVEQLSELLKLEPYLDRKPAELSGGQQQRVAIARALAKEADLVLLDEPLANLDYKLREELLAELPRLFAGSKTIAVYATSESIEALKLGAFAVSLREGRVTQAGASSELYRQPANIETARVMSDAPLNVFMSETGSVAGIRAHHLRLGTGSGSARTFPVTVKGADVTGSETFVHLMSEHGDWTMLMHGVQTFRAGEHVTVHAEQADILRFDAANASGASWRA